MYGKVEDDTSDEDEDSGDKSHEEESGDDEDNAEEMIFHGKKIARVQTKFLNLYPPT